MTEQEARTKWCPMVRITWYPTPAPETSISGWNRDEMNTNCMASDCMMWRWHGGRRPEKQMEAARGYCGLGGKP